MKHFQRSISQGVDINRDLSYGKKVTAILSAKNSRKTTYAKKLAINTFLYHGDGTIWMRRDLNEVGAKNQLFVTEFFDRFTIADYADHKFYGKVSDHGAVFYIDDKPFIWVFALKTCNKFGGNTLPLHIRYYIIDEFIPNPMLQQSELANEAYLHFNFFNSITRPANDARVLLLGNPALDTSCYFDLYGMRDTKNERTIGPDWMIHHDRRDYSSKSNSMNAFQTAFTNYVNKGETLMAKPVIERCYQYRVLFNLVFNNSVYTVAVASNNRLYVCPYDGNKASKVGSRTVNTSASYYDISAIFRTAPFKLFLLLVRSDKIMYSDPYVTNIRGELYRLAKF